VRNRCLAIAVLFCLASGLQAETTIVLVPNGVSGGGFQSDVTLHSDRSVVYSSGDVSGVHKSTDGGLSYTTKNEGLKSLKVASLAITPDNEKILYAGTGDKGGSGGLYVSEDGGDTWSRTLAGDSVQFAGNHSADGDPLPDGHPRSNGNLIAIDIGGDSTSRADDVVIAGTYATGIVFLSGGGATVEGTVNGSGFVRSVAIHPNVPERAYAAIYFDSETENGIYEIDYTDIADPTSALVYATSQPEEIVVFDNGHVYAAIGESGMAAYDGTSWSTINAGLTFDSTHVWSAVAGYVAGDHDVVYATANNSETNSGSYYSSVWRSENSGLTWSPLVDHTSNVSDHIYDGTPGGAEFWWYRDSFVEGNLGRRQTAFSTIEISLGASATSPSDDILYVSGRGGIWKSDDGGATWHPAVNNLQVTANRDVAVNPDEPSQVVLGNTDYVVLASGSHFDRETVVRDKPEDPELGSRGYDVVFDPVADLLILAAGSRDANRDGEVYTKPSASVGVTEGDWTDTGLSEVTDSRIPRAVAYGYHDGSTATTQTLLAAVQGDGVYRYHLGTWTRSTGISIGETKRSHFAWPDSGESGVVYLLDLQAGLHRSVDGGQTWLPIWAGMNLNNKDFYNAGYIAADDDDPSTIYLSIQGGLGSYVGTGFRVYRLSNADVTFFDDPATDPNVRDLSVRTDGSTIDRPGPLDLGPDGRLWLTSQQDSANSYDAGFYMMENPSIDTEFVDLTTDAYRDSVPEPVGLDVASDGYAFIAQSGTGIATLQIVTNSPPTDLLLDSVTVDEHLPPPATVGVLTGIDPDPGETFAYSLNCDVSGADSGLFQVFNGTVRTRDIDPESDEDYLDFADPKDANGDGRYEICVRVRDQAGAKFDKNFTVTVNDIYVLGPAVVLPRLDP